MLLSLVACALCLPQATPTIEAGRAALGRQDFAAAEAIFAARVEQDAEDAQAWHLLGMALHAQRKLDAALEAHVRAATFPSTKASATYNAACAHALLGDADTAIDWLERACDAGFRDRGRCFTDPDLQALRSDPRFLRAVPPLRVGNDAFREDVRVLHEFHGENAGDQFGWVARWVGDIDEDGAVDFGTTAPSWPGNGQWRGKVYVYSSKRGELLFAHEGQPGARLGNSVSAAGDVDGDGRLDVLVGAPAGGQQAGCAYVYSGVDGAELLRLSAGEANDGFGLKVCELGDLDGDGHGDVAIGAPRCDAAGADSGRVYAYSGATGKELFRIDGEAAGDRFGTSIDATLDPRNRLLIVGAVSAGERNVGRCYVYAVDRFGAEPAFTIEPDETGANLGQYFVTAIGDVDGDGVGDVYASDWNNAALGPNTGRVYVHSGATGERCLIVTGHRPGEGFGTSVSDAGDVDGDGHVDLIVGAWQNPEGAASAGKCYLHSGADGALLATYTSTVGGDTLGFDATNVGDVDGDGGIDFLLTSAWSSVRGVNTGRVFIVAGPVLAAD